MTARKQKEKERRRARKLAEQAWEAVHAGNLQLAEKIIRRAVATQPDNPVLWNDHGVLLALLQDAAGAAAAFRSALSLAPDFAEPYAHLAALRVREGFVAEAVSLQAQAVNNAPGVARYVEQLAAYRALAGQAADEVPIPQPRTDSVRPPVPAAAPSGLVEGLAAYDWPELGDRLNREGCVVLGGLLDADACARLRGLFDEDTRFARTVVMDRPEFGLGTYRYFRAPLPAVVDGLRHAVYPYLARIANDWQRLLGETVRYPEMWEEFRAECAAAGQTTPTPILLRYGPGGFNALHRDLRGAVFFPVQMAVVLSPRADRPEAGEEGFRGGEFLFCDVPERGKSRRRSVPAGLGDAVLFCTRDRLVRVGGAYGLQPVKHGVAPITAGTRVVLGVPFHEYR